MAGILKIRRVNCGQSIVVQVDGSLNFMYTYFLPDNKSI